MLWTNVARTNTGYFNSISALHKHQQYLDMVRRSGELLYPTAKFSRCERLELAEYCIWKYFYIRFYFGYCNR